jgi:hypothetical protein
MKRSRITIETRQLIIVRSGRVFIHSWCSTCGEEVRMLGAEQAARLADLTPRAICDLADAGTLHFIVSPDGSLFICFNSLTINSDLKGELS